MKLPSAILLLLTSAIALTHAALAAAPPAQPVPGADLFTNGSVVSLAIELAPASLESLRRDPRRKVPATVKEGGRTYPNVAVHLKGAQGSFRDVDDRPGLSLNFHFLAPGQRFHGLRKIMLNNSVQDPSYLNEKLAGDLFRAAGVPAPRTSHALVKCNGRQLGLYVLKEGFSRDFLALHFANTTGNLYDINPTFYDLGNGSDLRQRFRRDDGDEPTSHADLAQLIAACQEKDLAQRWAKLDASLDLDRFISFMAMEIITCHCDGYSTYGHNIRLYHDPNSRKLVFIPNDMDRMFKECRESLRQPGFSALVSKALVETPQGRQRYLDRCAALATNVFNLARLSTQVSELSDSLRRSLLLVLPEAANEFDAQVQQVQELLYRRAEAIRKEFPPPAASETSRRPGS